MRIYTSEQAAELLEQGTQSPSAVLTKDERGQFIISTHLYQWSDKTIRDVPEFATNEDDDEHEPLHPFGG